MSAGSDLQLLSSFLRLCCAPLSLGAFTTFPFRVLLGMLLLSRAEVDPDGQELIPWCCSGGASPAHPDFPAVLCINLFPTLALPVFTAVAQLLSWKSEH